MSGPINVLLIDDDEVDCYIARRQLTKHPLVGTIHEVHSATAALELFEPERFEAEFGPNPPRTLVLLDINMPTMSGFEFLERLEELGQRAAVDAAVIAMLTSSSYFGDHERASAFDLVEGYIEKPLTLDKIGDLIDRFWHACES